MEFWNEKKKIYIVMVWMGVIKINIFIKGYGNCKYYYIVYVYVWFKYVDRIFW